MAVRNVTASRCLSPPRLKPHLSQVRTTQLEGVGFNWDARKKNGDKQWEVRFNELVGYEERNGNCNVPQSQCKLGKWVNNKQQLQKKGKLSYSSTTCNLRVLDSAGVVHRKRTKIRNGRRDLMNSSAH